MAHAAYTTSRARNATLGWTVAAIATILSAIWAKEMTAATAPAPTFARVAMALGASTRATSTSSVRGWARQSRWPRSRRRSKASRASSGTARIARSAPAVASAAVPPPHFHG